MTTLEEYKRKVDWGDRFDVIVAGTFSVAFACFFVLLPYGNRKDTEAQIPAPATLASTPAPNPQEQVSPPEEIPPASQEGENAVVLPPTPQFPVVVPVEPMLGSTVGSSLEVSVTETNKVSDCGADACLTAPRSGLSYKPCGRPVLNDVPPDMPRSVLNQFISDTFRTICPKDGSPLHARYKDSGNQQVGVLTYPDGREVRITWFIK